MGTHIPSSLMNVLKLLEERGEPLPADEVAKALGVKKQTARKYLNQLVKLGLVVRLPTGDYAVPKALEKPSEEAKPAEEKPAEPVEAKSEEAKVEEPAKPEEKPVGEKPPVEASAEEKPSPEVKAASEPFYFFYKGQPVPLAVHSLEQLYAVIKYKLVPPEALAYQVSAGYLQAWLTSILGEKSLAEELDSVKGAPVNELLKKVEEAVGSRVAD